MKSKSFYGYYLVMVLINNEGYDMLSVKGLISQVWNHKLHGASMQEIELF